MLLSVSIVPMIPKNEHQLVCEEWAKPTLQVLRERISS